MEVSFPQFRKYKGIDVWFLIKSEREFVEYKVLGQRVIETKVIAEQYPEIVRINDMLTCHEGRWEKVSEVALNKAIKNV